MIESLLQSLHKIHEVTDIHKVRENILNWKTEKIFMKQILLNRVLENKWNSVEGRRIQSKHGL